MHYIDYGYYAATFGGTLADEEFSDLRDRAEEVIEEMTMYRLTPVTFAAMPEDVQERIRKAVCAQMEYLDANGGSDLDNGTELQSASLGKFSYTKAGTDASGKASLQAPRAQRILAPTGLLYRGGGWE